MATERLSSPLVPRLAAFVMLLVAAFASLATSSVPPPTPAQAELTVPFANGQTSRQVHVFVTGIDFELSAPGARLSVETSNGPLAVKPCVDDPADTSRLCFLIAGNDSVDLIVQLDRVSADDTPLLLRALVEGEWTDPSKFPDLPLAEGLMLGVALELLP